MQRESMEYDVVIVGAGPSGLSAAIRLRQLAREQDRECSVCVIEKGSEVGAHILSGAVLEPRALNELISDWKDKDAPLQVPVKSDSFQWLGKKRAISLPVPPQMHNDGNFIISLGNLCRWLAEQAEAEGADIFPGFAAAEVLYHEDGSVRGIATGDMGIGKDGQPTDQHQPGMELHAKSTFFAEGCRGSLTAELFQRFDLRDGVDPQTYGIGIKELWEVDNDLHDPGHVLHTIGWPLDKRTYGGSFIYHLDNKQLAAGFVVGLDYQNPHLSPFEEFQRFKTHPAIRPLFENGRRISYGARALSEGGLQSMPKLVFPGGLLIGDCAGVLNMPKIKGTHTSMKTGMLAAEAVFAQLASEQSGPATAYSQAINKSWIHDELHSARNIRPAFRWGLWPAIAYSAIDTYLLRGKAPWTMHHHPDHSQLKKADQCPVIDYPKPDGTLTFDRLSSVYLSGTNHEENQPSHLTLKDDTLPISLNYAEYDAPEVRFCPAGVYEIVEDDGNKHLQINAQNCVHCKTCDIKDFSQNIVWKVPEGGGGPNYPNM